MSEKKELNQEQLEKVNGGNHYITTAGDISKYSEYVNVIEGEQAVQGEKYLFRPNTLTTQWLYGKLSNKYKTWGVWTYDVKVEDGLWATNNFIVSDWDTLEVRADGGWRPYKK